MKKRFHKKTYLNLLDIGSGKVACMVVRLTDDQAPTVVGAACVPSKGIQAGSIWNLEEATACVGEAIRQAEVQSGQRIESVIVNISSTQLHSLQVYHEVAIPPGKPISAQDVQVLVDGIVSQHVPVGEEVLHAFPLGYIVDKDQGLTDPRGVFANTLGAHVHMVTLPETQTMNLLTVLDRCHVSVQMKVATPYASALAVLSEDEKDVGSTVLDFGAGTTSYAVFVGGGLMQLGVIQTGGHQMTRDIAQALNTNLANAERLKVLNGAAYLSPRDELERVIVPVLGDEEGSNIQIKRSHLIGVIVPRLENILEKTKMALDKDSTFTSVAKNFVLTGGGAGLAGLKEKVVSFLGGISRLGKTKQIKNLPSEYDLCTFNVCVGLLMYALKRRQDKVFEQFQSTSTPKGLLGKVIKWIKQSLS
jgi:cell division protein FtsA